MPPPARPHLTAAGGARMASSFIPPCHRKLLSSRPLSETPLAPHCNDQALRAPSPHISSRPLLRSNNSTPSESRRKCCFHCSNFSHYISSDVFCCFKENDNPLTGEEAVQGFSLNIASGNRTLPSLSLPGSRHKGRAGHEPTATDY